MKSTIVTNHARERAKQRLGVSKKTTDKIAEKALSFGVTHAQSTGNLKHYLSKLYLKYKTANNIRVYNRKIYIFNDVNLITIMNLPNSLIKIADKNQKKNNK